MGSDARPQPQRAHRATRRARCRALEQSVPQRTPDAEPACPDHAEVPGAQALHCPRSEPDAPNARRWQAILSDATQPARLILPQSIAENASEAPVAKVLTGYVPPNRTNPIGRPKGTPRDSSSARKAIGRSSTASEPDHSPMSSTPSAKSVISMIQSNAGTTSRLQDRSQVKTETL